MSSSCPGPSPTKTSSALGFPTPNTILVRALCKRQRVHSPRSARMSSSVSLGTRSAASKSVGPDGTEIIGRDGPALAVSGVATLPAATDLAEEFAADDMFIDVDRGGADTRGDETDDSVRVKKYGPRPRSLPY